MKLYDKKGKLEICRCGDESSFEPVHGGERDEEGIPLEYQCLVCGAEVEGEFWGEE